MKILLVEPPKSPRTFGGEEVFLYEPLALEYVAAGVIPDHDVRILDLRVERDLSGVLDEFRPDVVGLTGYTVHLNVVRGLLARIKQWDPHVLTVVGGHHATIRPEDFIGYPADLVVLGEGVTTFREIVGRHERGRGFEDAPGLAWTHDGELARSAPPGPVDLDALPLPARELTAPHRGRYYSEWMRPLASMRTSKGCPHRCNFCALWKIAGGRYFRRDPARIVDELGTIPEPYVFFADDESLVDAKRMADLADRIGAYGIAKRYFLYGRSDTIARNPGLLERWRRIGLERVFVGLEFFRDEDLRFIGKGSTLADNERAVRILHDLGIEVYASFIVRPEFDREDFAALKDYCRRLRLSFASFAVLTPLPGTDLMAEVEGRLITRDPDLFDFIHTVLPTKLPLPEFYEELCRLYRDAIPLRRAVSHVGKYPWRDVPRLLARSRRLMVRMRALAADYA